MRPRKKTTGVETIEILQIDKNSAEFWVLGRTPLLMNRMSKKAREQLLLPPVRKNAAAREQTLKHDPIAEYNEAVYRCRENDAPTLIHLPEGCFKKAMAQAALDIPGSSKAQIGRLVSVTGQTVHLYGRPFLHMSIVRPPGQAPDVRTRAVFPQWACKVTVSYIRHLIAEKDIMNLFAAAGIITGVGDGRPEKGALDYGQWELVDADNKEWHAIAKQARRVQVEAMAKPQAFDADTEELLAWFGAEIARRGREPVREAKTPAKRGRKPRRNGGDEMAVHA